MSTFRYHHVRTICFLPPIFGDDGGIYYLHNRSNVSLDTLRIIFSGYTIRCTTPPMTEVMINCAMNEELRDYKRVIYYTFRSLLESGDTRNDDKVFIYCTALSVLIEIILKANEMYTTRSKINKIKRITNRIIESVKPRILNEEYLNYKFCDWYEHVKLQMIDLNM